MSDLQKQLDQEVARLIPGAELQWYSLPDSSLRGRFLERECALRPLPADKVSQLMDEPPFWALLWPSGEFLCRLLEATPELVAGRTVLDFGCGSGLVACAAHRAKAGRVVAVDCDESSRLATLLNAEANGAALEILPAWDESGMDLLILADFLYDEQHLPLFERLDATAGEVIVVDSRLKSLPRDGFVYLGESSGTACPDIDLARDFGCLRFWYRGSRALKWRSALGAVAHLLQQC